MSKTSCLAVKNEDDAEEVAILSTHAQGWNRVPLNLLCEGTWRVSDYPVAVSSQHSLDHPVLMSDILNHMRRVEPLDLISRLELCAAETNTVLQATVYRASYNDML